MKDTKTVLPMVNGGGNGDNKNVLHSKIKVQENGNPIEHRSTNLKSNSDNEELIGGCCVCSDDQGFANNALVYCDGKGCTVACHTACYGIVSIPDGDWYCGRCEAGDIRAPCRLCPTTEGAMKRSSDGGWAHVVCALYIPEVSFGDNTTMEPIILSKVPSTRFGQECSICVQNGRSKLVATSGACCGCTVKNCSQVFHVTCAQANGFLCEDVRKNTCQYPIYCEQHRPKLSKFIRQIPAFQYSPNAIATTEQLKRQNLFLKEKESPSQLSDFIAAAAAEAAAVSENPRLSSSLNDTNNQNNTSDEQQTPVSRTFHASDILQRKSSLNTNSSLSSSTTSLSPGIQHKTHSRSSSSSSSTNSSIQKKSKINDDTNNNHNRSLTDLSQFVQLNKDERNFLPPAPPNQSNEQETNKSNVTNNETKEMISDNSKLSNPTLDQQSSLSSIEEKPLASRFSMSSPTANKSPMKQRQSIDSSTNPIKTITIKKSTTIKSKDVDDDEDYEVNKKRKLPIKLNKDGQPRKKRQHSVEGGPRPVGRPPTKKPVVAQQGTNSSKRPLFKTSTNNNNNNMKQQKSNDNLITMHDNSSHNNDYETKLTSRSTNYYQCDHFGNQINSDAFKQHGHIDESSQQISPIHTNEENARSRTLSSSTTSRIDFYPRRPLQMTSSASTNDQQSQRTFPPQTLEEFLEQEWESSSDFLLQQTMPHDVSALLSCLYQFKSENASLQKKFDELKHRRDSLRVTNANLRRRLSEILPISDTISSTTAVPPPPPPPPPPTTATTTLPTTTITQVSPPPAPISAMLAIVPPSPRKEQQQLKQQKLLAELELQQQLQQQKAISPSRRRLSTTATATTTTTTTNHYSDSTQSTIKKSKSPRQPNAVTHPSLLESQLRQSPSSNNQTTTKKQNTSATIPTSKKLASSDLELVSSHPTSSATTVNSSVLPTTGSITTTPAYEQIDVTTTAAAAYALAKNSRTSTNTGLSLELLSQILTASSSAIGPQLFAPTWNISNFGYANFPGANQMSVSDESILRSFAPTAPPPLEQQQQQQQQQSSTTSQTSSKSQP